MCVGEGPHMHIPYASKERDSMDKPAINKCLGWVSLARGAAEVFARGKIASLVGAPGRSAIVWAFGARELAVGAGIFHSPNTAAPVWGRVAGDALEIGRAHV